MESLRGIPLVLLLGILVHTVRGQGDFDLADALDDPEPTKKPSSGIYPKPPYPPQPGDHDNTGNIYPRPKPPAPRPQPGGYDNSVDIYPKPKPPAPRPQPGGYDHNGGYSNDIDHNGGHYPPRPQPPSGGGGYHPSHDSSGGTYGGDGYSTSGDPQGNTIAKIVSPIVSVVVVTLVGAATSYFSYNRRRNCFRRNEPETV